MQIITEVILRPGKDTQSRGMASNSTPPSTTRGNLRATQEVEVLTRWSLLDPVMFMTPTNSAWPLFLFL